MAESVEVQVSLENLGNGEVREQVVTVEDPAGGFGTDAALRALAIEKVHRRAWFFESLTKRGPFRVVTRAFPSAKELKPDA